jgi:hypothetical protein
MGVYARGSKLWIRFRDACGKWRDASTGYTVGQEDLAQSTLDKVLVRVRQAASPTSATSRVLTLRAFAEAWLANRQTETAADDRGRIYNHILPVLGDIPLTELRPRQVRDFVDSLRKKKPQGIRRKDGSLSPTDEVLAPRTIRHICGTLRAMLNDAVADELIPSSPCVLKDELPAKRDKDRTWRRTAVFTRDEVEMIISAESTPDDRRVLASLMFLGAMRFGEAAALTWRDYDATCAPLGKLVIEKSYSTKKRKVKGTKTDNPARCRCTRRSRGSWPGGNSRGSRSSWGARRSRTTPSCRPAAARTGTPTRACGGSTRTWTASACGRGASTTRGARSSRSRGRTARWPTRCTSRRTAPTATSWTTTRRCRGRRCAPRWPRSDQPPRGEAAGDAHAAGR